MVVYFINVRQVQTKLRQFNLIFFFDAQHPCGFMKIEMYNSCFFFIMNLSNVKCIRKNLKILLNMCAFIFNLLHSIYVCIDFKHRILLLIVLYYFLAFFFRSINYREP